MSFDTLQETKSLVDGYAGIWIKGTVKNNVDPNNMDRVQIEVPGLYESGLGELPWVGPLKLSSFGIGDGYGVYGTPKIGSDVIVWLQDGDPNYPVYMHVQTKANDTFPSGTSWGFQDPDGNQLLVQGKDVKFTSGGGLVFHIADNGDLTVTAPSGGHATFNIDNVTYNSQNVTFNASTLFKVVGQTNINNATIDPAGDAVFPALVTTTGLLTMLDGFSMTGGTALALGVDIGPLHTHSNVRIGTDFSGPVVP